MKTLIKLLPLLFLIVFLGLILGYLIFDFKFLVLLPYLIVNLLLFTISLAWVNTKSGWRKIILAIFLIGTSSFSLLIIFKLIELKSVWIILVAATFSSILLVLNDLACRLTPKFSKLIHFSSGIGVLGLVGLICDLNSMFIAISGFVLSFLIVIYGLSTSTLLNKSSETI